MPGDNHLSRRVKVNRRNNLPFGRFFTGFSNRGIIQTDDRRHAASTFRNRFLHEFTTHFHQTNGISKVDDASANQRGIFAQAVTCH
ncbi:Uncharacterised protein [Salmonella enterica subsp. enterica serovar Bovismorbificans]|nr:Uncharacterised protein [Salmonella enterica subsp. enterica serovar Bovismorbificans]CQB66049.1 Uncharacterised protein [Salmonella enterica subsp. enterica serovar Bovismorbificans]